MDNIRTIFILTVSVMMYFAWKEDRPPKKELVQAYVKTTEEHNTETSYPFELEIHTDSVEQGYTEIQSYYKLFERHFGPELGLLVCSQTILESGWPSNKSFLAKAANNLGGMKPNSRCYQDTSVKIHITYSSTLIKPDSIKALGKWNYYIVEPYRKNKCGQKIFCMRKVYKTSKKDVWRRGKETFAIYDNKEDFVLCLKDWVSARIKPDTKTVDSYANKKKKKRYFTAPLSDYKRSLGSIYNRLKRKI